MLKQVQHESVGVWRGPVPPPADPRAGRLRVLHIVARLGMGGMEHGLLKVMNGLGEDDFEHRICAVRGIDASFAVRMNISTQSYSAGSSEPGFQFPLFRVARIMKEFHPHIVHTHNFGALDGILSARVARVPVTVHSEHGYELDTVGGLPLRRRIICRALYAMADALFTVTEDLRAYHSSQSWLPLANFRVINNGVNTDRFSPRPETSEKSRAALGIPAGRMVVGSVGRLVPIKDYETLLRAAGLLLRRGKDVHVLIVGSGPEQTKLEAGVAASPELQGRVTFVGASDRVPELLNAMDVFALPSISEGMSNTTLEAMACGLPVVVTRTGGNPELTDNGRSGCLFSPRNFEALAEILSSFHDDTGMRVALGAAARRRAVEQFSLTGMVQRYRELYFELAANRGLRKPN